MNNVIYLSTLLISYAVLAYVILEDTTQTIFERNRYFSEITALFIFLVILTLLK